MPSSCLQYSLNTLRHRCIKGLDELHGDFLPFLQHHLPQIMNVCGPLLSMSNLNFEELPDMLDGVKIG